LAVASPIPREPPVTNATFPVSEAIYEVSAEFEPQRSTRIQH
jgi:hypothetical protein